MDFDCVVCLFVVLLQPQFSPSLLGAQPTAAIVAVSQHQQPASALPLAMSIVGNHTVTQSTVPTNGNGIEGQTNGNSIVSREMRKGFYYCNRAPEGMS